jgi:hypothetical protein
MNHHLDLFQPQSVDSSGLLASMISLLVSPKLKATLKDNTQNKCVHCRALLSPHPCYERLRVVANKPIEAWLFVLK